MFLLDKLSEVNVPYSKQMSSTSYDGQLEL